MIYDKTYPRMEVFITEPPNLIGKTTIGKSIKKIIIKMDVVLNRNHIATAATVPRITDVTP